MNKLVIIGVFIGIISTLLVINKKTNDELMNEFFMDHPIQGVMPTKSGDQTYPFHMRKAKITQLFGYMNVKKAKDIVKGGESDENVRFEPLIVNNKGVLALWLMQYEDTTCGAYDEIVISVLTKEKNNNKVNADIENVEGLAALLLRPGVSGFIGELWLNETIPIDYGREILEINKHKVEMKSTFDFKSNSDYLSLNCVHQDNVLVSGKFRITATSIFSQIKAIWYMIQETGMILIKALISDRTSVVLSTRLDTYSSCSPKSLVTFFNNGDAVVNVWDNDRDTLSGTIKSDYEFEPQVIVSVRNRLMAMYPKSGRDCIQK